ncbi:MAG: hypothetical protein ACJ76I_11720 [Gaiellaceae bacterium]
MKRLLALLAGGLGLRAILKRRSRRSRRAQLGAQPGGSPAQELRAKLAETKEPDGEPELEAAEPDAAPEPKTLDDRRADVHARARQAMQDLGEPEP